MRLGAGTVEVEKHRLKRDRVQNDENGEQNLTHRATCHIVLVRRIGYRCGV